jgi:hypothetical protein
MSFSNIFDATQILAIGLWFAISLSDSLFLKTGIDLATSHQFGIVLFAFMSSNNLENAGASTSAPSTIKL